MGEEGGDGKKEGRDRKDELQGCGTQFYKEG